MLSLCGQSLAKDRKSIDLQNDSASSAVQNIAAIGKTKDEDTSKVSNSHKSQKNTTEPEELPKPEGLFSLFWRPALKYSGPYIPRGFRKSKPLMLPGKEINRIRGPLDYAPLRYRKNNYREAASKNQYSYRKNDRFVNINRHSKPRSRNSYYRNHRNNENNYALYSPRSPYLRRQAPHHQYYPPPPRTITLWTSLMNTGSGFLKMLNPFNLLRSSPPPNPHYNSPPKYRQPNDEFSLYHEDDNGNVLDNVYDDYDSQNYRHPHKNEEAYQDDLHYRQRFPSAYFETNFDTNSDKDHSSSTFNADSFFTNSESDYQYEDEYNKYPQLPTSYDSRINNHKNHRFTMTLNPEIINHVSDYDTLEYLKEQPLRNDLYIGKDGNIYLKDEFSSSNSNNANLYGTDYSEMEQENKHFDMYTAGQNKIPVYVSSSSDSLSKDNHKHHQVGDKSKKQKKSRHMKNVHSKFALRELAGSEIVAKI